MLLFLTFFYTLAGFTQLELPGKIAHLYLPVHKACLAMAPVSIYRPEYQAVICGGPANAVTAKTSLTRSGLWFAICSVGSHFLILEWIIHCIPRATAKRNNHFHWLISTVFYLTLFGLTLLSGFTAPAVRASVRMGLTALNSRLHLNWTPTQIISSASVLALYFCTTSASLNGLYFGWIAALALHVGHVRSSQAATNHPPHFQNRVFSPLWVQIRLYLLLLPALLPFSVPNPWTILTAYFFFPALSVLLFIISLGAFISMSFGSTIARYCLNISDSVWQLFNWLAQSLAEITPSGLQPLSVPLLVSFAYLLTLTAWSAHLDVNS